MTMITIREAAEMAGQVGVGAQRQGDVGERADGHQVQPVDRPGGVADEADRIVRGLGPVEVGECDGAEPGGSVI